MAITTISRFSFTDDTGDGESGDILNGALFGTAIYDKIDALLAAAITTGSTLRTGFTDDSTTYTQSNDNLLAGNNTEALGVAGGTALVNINLYLKAVADRKATIQAGVGTGDGGKLILFVKPNGSATMTNAVEIASSANATFSGKIIPAGPTGSAGQGFYFAANGLYCQGGTDGIIVQKNDNSGRNLQFPDGGGIIVTQGDIIPSVDNTHSVGLGATRFTLVRAVTITPGDIVFDNGWAITEGSKLGMPEGLAFLDETGELVAFVGRSGFRHKGGAGPADVDEIPYVPSTATERAQMDPHPEQRIVAYDEAGGPIFRVRADRALPDPTKGKSNKVRTGGGA